MGIYEWEEIADDTERLWVYEGWLVRTFAYELDQKFVSMCFISDPCHEWRI